MPPKPLGARRWKAPRLPKGLKKEEAVRIINKMRERLNASFDDKGVVKEAQRCLKLYPYKYPGEQQVPRETTRGMEHYLLFNYAKEVGFTKRELYFLQNAVKIQEKSGFFGGELEKFVQRIGHREFGPFSVKINWLQNTIRRGEFWGRGINLPDKDIEELTHIIVVGNGRALSFINGLSGLLYKYWH